MNRRWDVIVVGARIAGAATAMLLARGGLRVLCLDRSHYGSDTLSTHAFMRGGVQQLRRWGLLDDLIAAGTPAVRRTVFHYGEDSVRVSIKPSGGVDALYAPRRTVIDALLVDAARSAGAVVEFGAPVLRLHRDQTGDVAGVVVGDRRLGTERVERAPLVVGADGRESLLAAEVGAAPFSAGQHAGAFLYGYWANLPTDGYEWFYRLGITAGLIPTNAGVTCAFIGAPPSRLQSIVQSRNPGSAFQVLSGEAGLRPRIETAEKVGSVKYVRGLPGGYLRKAHGPGWALVGDAGHWMDPMSTHGMTSALRDATLLAQAILSAQTDLSLLPGKLSAYEAVRNRLATPMMRATDEIASYTWDLKRVHVLLRSLASAFTDEVETLASLEADSGR